MKSLRIHIKDERGEKYWCKGSHFFETDGAFWKTYMLDNDFVVFSYDVGQCFLV